MSRVKLLVVAALAGVIGLGSLPVMAATAAKTKPAVTSTTKVKKTSTVNKKKVSKTGKTAKPHAVSTGKKKPGTAKTGTAGKSAKTGAHAPV